MTDRSKLLALAMAVEKLTGPDRDVDDAIIDAFGWRNDFGVPIPPGYIGLPMYTGSLDAAMKLVPEGWRLELEQHSSSWTAQLANAPWFDDRRQIVDADGPTAIIALLSSALRAQAEALA